MRANLCIVLAVFSLGRIASTSAADFTATADAYIDTATPTANFGTAATLRVGNKNKRLALVRFNTASISSPGVATLKLRVRQVFSAGTIYVSLVRADWNEAAVTSAARPAIDSAPFQQRTIATTDVGKIVTLDVSQALAAWVNTPASNFGLAISAASPNVNVYLDSRESANPPVLSVVNASQITVAKSGGNYADPIVAAKNAFTGNHWCISSSPPTAPCRMLINPGIYILSETLALPNSVTVLGSETNETILLARKGLETAVRANDNSISDLSIVNHQDAAPSAVGLLGGGAMKNTVTRVAIQVAGAQQNIGVRSLGTDTAIAQSSIAAVGGATTLALDDDAGSVLDLVDCRIAATDATQINTGLSIVGAPASLTNTSVEAAGGAEARGVRLAAEGMNFTISGGTISASSPGVATAVTTIDVYLNLIGTAVTARSPNSIGIDWQGTFNQLTMDGTHLQSSATGIKFSDQGTGDLQLLRSYLLVGTIALQMTERGANGTEVNAHVDGSTVRTTGSLFETQGTSLINLKATNSVLDGAFGVPGGALPSCVGVYGTNYGLLKNNCRP